MNEVTEGTLLNGRLRYRQFATGHRSGFEPVLMAATVAARAGERVLDLGTGSGAALLCLAARLPGLLGIGVEIDPALAGLAAENFKINDLTDFFALQTDAARLPFSEGKFDHVMANPPWHAAAGTASPDPARALAHHAAPSLMPAWIEQMARVLVPRGTLTLIIPAASAAIAIHALQAQKFSGTTLFPLWPREKQAAKQVILQARRAGAARLLPGLTLHDAVGITPQANAVLKDGASIQMG